MRIIWRQRLISKRWKRAGGLVLVGICFLTFAVRARAEQKWTKINSANFEMFTTAGEKAGRRMILYFEQLSLR